MKKVLFSILFAGIISLLGAGTLHAQDFGGMPSPEEMAKMQADQMKDVVKLTDAQYPKVLEIFKEQSKKMSDMFSGGGMPDQDKMTKLFQEQDEKLKKVLTEEQHKKWTEHIQKMFQNMGGGF